MFTKKFTVIISFFLIIAIGVGGMLGYYDARLEAAVTPKKQSMDKVKIKNEEDLTFDKDVVNILLVGSDNGAQGSEKGDHGRSDSMMVATINFKTKKFTVIISFFLIIAIGVGGMLGYYDARLEAAVTPKKQSMDKVKIKNEEDLTFDKDVVNILLVGSDNGAQGSEKGDHGRSDSMMVATINFKTKELKLTSFLRDMYVEIPGHGRNKLNAAYAFGGEALLYQTLAQNFNIKIDKFCVVDLAAFEKVINRIGGIEMTLEQREAEYLNTTNYISKKKYRNVKVGKQTLNGNQALGYARVRHVFSKKYGVEEFGRTGRQRAVMQATFQKMLQQNPLDLVDIAIDALGDVSTDMDATYIKKLILSVAKMGTTEIDQLRVPIENTYKTAVAGSYPPCGYVFFVNFKANQEALKYFMFNKGKRQDFAKNYGGADAAETCGYPSKYDYNRSKGDSGNIFNSSNTTEGE